MTPYSNDAPYCLVPSGKKLETLNDPIKRKSLNLKNVQILKLNHHLRYSMTDRWTTGQTDMSDYYGSHQVNSGYKKCLIRSRIPTNLSSWFNNQYLWPLLLLSLKK